MSNKEQYKIICSKYGDIPIFLQYWWMEVVCSNWDVAICMNGEQVAGVWPYNIESKLGVSLLRTPVLTPYQGPYVIYPKDLKAANKDGFENETIAWLLKQLPDSKVWDLTTLPGLKQVGLFKQAGLDISTRQTFLLDITNEESQLLANMKESLRRNIKNAHDQIEIVNDNTAIPLLYEYNKSTLDSKDVIQAYTKLDMQNLMKACIDNNCGAIYVAKQQGAILGIVWNVWDTKSSYYYMGALNPEIDNYKVMPALLWHCIKQAKLRGNIVFDFEGSMDAGVEKFFRSFGSDKELYLILKKNASLIWRLKELIRQ